MASGQPDEGKQRRWIILRRGEMVRQAGELLTPKAQPPTGADTAGLQAESIGERMRRVVSQIERRQANGFYHQVETLRSIVGRLIQSGDLELSES